MRVDKELNNHIKICKCDSEIFPTNARAILNVLGDMGSNGWWDWHIQENFQYMSPGFWKFLGYDCRTMPHTPESWMKIANKQDVKGWVNDLQAQILKDKKKAEVSRVINFTKKDGSNISMLCQGKVIEWGKKREPLRMVGTYTDISHLLTIEQELIQEQEMINDFFNSTPTGMAMCTPDGDFIDVNRAFCKITGHTKKSLLTKNFKDITHEDDLDDDISKVKEMLNNDSNSYQIKKRYIRSNGTVSWVNLVVVCARDKNGNVIRFFSQVIDMNSKMSKGLDIANTVKEIQHLLRKD